MNQLFENPLYSVGLLVVYLALISFIGLGSWGVIESSEARFAEISREVAVSGDWAHPTLLGIKHFHKPPVTYWVTALGYNFFGVNAFGARFFLVISYVSQVVLLYLIARKLFSNHFSGLVAAALYSGLPIVLVSARGLTADSYLMTCILAAVWLWIRWRSESRTLLLYLIAVALGIGFLTKGPVVLIIPIFVMLGVKPFNSGIRTRFSFHHLGATLLFFVIASSWFVMLIMEDRQFVDYFLLRHTVDRYSNAGVFKRVEPWWYYLAYGPLLAMPWIATFFFKIRPTEKKYQTRLIRQILFFWVILPIVFFSISSSKLVLYVLPLFAGVVLVCTYQITCLSEKQLLMLEKIVLAFVAVVALALGIYPLMDNGLNLSVTLKFIPFIFLAGLTILYIMLRVIVQYKILFYSVYLTSFLLLYSSALIRYNDLQFNSTQSIAEWLQQNGLDNRTVLVYNQMLPSLSFHLQKPIISLNDGRHTLNREIDFEKSEAWKKELYNLSDSADRKRLANILQQPTVLVVKKDIQTSSAWIHQYYTQQQHLGQWKILY